MNKTNITYTKNGTTYGHTFPTRVSWATVETYLIMTAHIGRYAIRNANVKCFNLL